MSVSYRLRSLVVDISGPRKHELRHCIEQVQKLVAGPQNQCSVQKSPFSAVDFAHVPRKRWRVTYLKSRFKHRKAIRHYVFERYAYRVSFFHPFEVSAAVNCVLSSLCGGLRASCAFAWQFGPIPEKAACLKEDAIVQRLEQRIAAKEPRYPD